LIFLGTSSGIPTLTRGVSSSALVLDSKNIWLFDCGEGTQVQFMKARLNFTKVTRIFITHLHGDHFFGLPGFLAMRTMKKATEPLEIFGPAGIQDLLATIFKATQSFHSYPITVTDLSEPIIAPEAEEIVVYPFPIVHRVPCWGYVLKETPRPGKFSTEKAVGLGVPKSKLGTLAKNNPVTLENGTVINTSDCLFPHTPGRHLVLLGDTCDPSSVLEAGQGCDILVHETTFEAKETEIALKSGHSTTEMAGKFAAALNAKNLIITHFSARYDDLNPLRVETEQVCPDTNVHIAEDFFQIELSDTHEVKTSHFPKLEVK